MAVEAFVYFLKVCAVWVLLCFTLCAIFWPHNGD